MPAVLIVEDTKNDFDNLRKKFKNEDWDVIPDKYEDLSEFFIEKKLDDLIKKVIDLAEINAKQLGSVVLDLKLDNNSSQDKTGLKILKKLREIQPPDGQYYYLWWQRLPIVVCSVYGDAQIKRTALNELSHAHSYITKDPSGQTSYVDDVVFACIALNSVFKLGHGSGYTDDLDRLWNKLNAMLVSQQEAISYKIDNIEYLLKGNFEDIQKYLGGLLIGIWHVMPAGNRKSFYEDNLDVLKDILGGEKFSNLESSIQSERDKDILTCIKESYREGDFSEFFDAIADLLGDTSNIPQLVFRIFAKITKISQT